MTKDRGMVECNRCGKVVAQREATRLLFDVHHCPSCVEKSNEWYLRAVLGVGKKAAGEGE